MIYYKTQIESETGKKLTTLFSKIKEARKVIREFAKEKLGASDVKVWDTALVGEVASFKADKNPYPLLFKKVKGSFVLKDTLDYSDSEKREKAKEHPIFTEFKQLPTVKTSEIHAILGWSEELLIDIVEKTRRWMYNARPGWIVKGEYIYLCHNYDEFDMPFPKDCVEITSSEYKAIAQNNS